MNVCKAGSSWTQAAALAALQPNALVGRVVELDGGQIVVIVKQVEPEIHSPLERPHDRRVRPFRLTQMLPQIGLGFLAFPCRRTIPPSLLPGGTRITSCSSSRGEQRE